jgi:tricorn protease
MRCQAARKRRKNMIRTTRVDHLRVGLLKLAMFAALVAFAGVRPAQAAFPDEAFPDGHGPIAFENDGDIWVASKMHLANLTLDSTDSKEADPVVSPDGRYVAFSSDRDGNFEIYLANVFTGEAQRITSNTVDDRKPVWSIGGQWISYRSPHYASPPTRVSSWQTSKAFK